MNEEELKAEERLRATQQELRDASAQLAAAQLKYKHAEQMHNAAFNDWTAARARARQTREDKLK